MANSEHQPQSIERRFKPEIDRIVADEYIRQLTLRGDIEGEIIDRANPVDLDQMKREHVEEKLEGIPVGLPWDVATIAFQKCRELVQKELGRGEA